MGRQYLPETTMASFGPQVKNMVQATAGGEGEEAFADGEGVL
jgi:phytoene/squalene synthetase